VKPNLETAILAWKESSLRVIKMSKGKDYTKY